MKVKKITRIVYVLIFFMSVSQAHASKCTDLINQFFGQDIKFKEAKFDIFDSDLISNEVINFKHRNLKKALNDLNDGTKLGYTPIGAGAEEPHSITIKNISISKNGTPTLTVSAVQDAYTYYGSYVGKVRFISMLKPDKDGNLKQVKGKSRFQLWDKQKSTWLDQVGGMPLEFGKRESKFFDNDIFTNKVVDFEHKGLKKALNQLGNGPELEFAPIGQGVDDPENITIRNISLTKRGVPTYTISAEQDAYTYYGDYVGRVRFISMLRPDKEGNLKRLKSKTSFQVWDSTTSKWSQLQ